MTASTASFHYTYDFDCLQIRAFNRAIVEDKDAAALEIASAIAARPIRAALLDLREVAGPFSFMDRVEMGEAAGRHLLGTPLAVMATEDQVDPDRIAKVVARNRGANVEVFTDETEARAWVEKYLVPTA